jgi:hypothetical protein
MIAETKSEVEDSLTELMNSGAKLLDEGKADEAVILLTDVIHGREAILGSSNADTLLAVNTLAGALKKLGQLEEAEVCYRRTYEGKEEQLGPHHK